MSDYKALYEKQLEENKKLKEKLQSFMGKAKLWETTAQNIEEKNTDLQEQIDELGTLCKNIDENAYNSWKEITEEESEAEEDKYDGDDWHWVYGKMIVDNEDELSANIPDVVLNIAGGGDHWENWIMRPTMNYIENKDGLHPQHGKVLVQSSCGKYLSFQDKDYVPDDGECICEYEISVEC